MSVDKTVDVLAIGAHPDDVELGCGGTVRKMVEQGYRVGVMDLTEGELGSRGSIETRRQESARASEILGIQERINLGVPDGQIENTKSNQLKIIEVVRRLRPDIVLIGSMECRHPDHGDATRLCIASLFYSGLRMVATGSGGLDEPWRPSHILHYMQSIAFEPTLVVDVDSTWKTRAAALSAYESQFDNPNYAPAEGEPVTFISDSGFLRSMDARARALGYRIGAEFGEGFLYFQGPFGVEDLVSTFTRPRRA